MKKLIFGMIISALFLYLTFRGVELDRILQGMRNARYGFLIPALGFLLLISFLRSLRWGVVLSSLEKIEQKKLFPLTCIGYMAVIVMPLRIGELLRPYLLSTSSQIPMGSALGTIVVERVLDILTILGILFLVVFFFPSPAWLLKTGYSLLPILLLLISFLFFLYFKMEVTLRFFKPVLKIFPEKISTKLEAILRNIGDGLSIISNPVGLFHAIVLSALIWTSSALVIFSLYFFLNFQLPLVSAFVVLVITIMGVSLPAAPGMVGNFQYAVILGLSLFSVDKTGAFIFSMVYYLLGIGLTIALGCICLPMVDISIKEIQKQIKFGSL